MKASSLKKTAGKLSMLVCVLCISIAAGGDMKEMSFNEFRDSVKTEGADEFEAVFDGNEFTAPVTGKKYIFAQILTWCGDPDLKSSYRTWNSEEDFFLLYKNIKVSLSPSKVRTFIEETGTFTEKDSNDGRILPSVEYGLIKNKKYYAKFSSEEYHLPPDRESGKPQKRTNSVLWISSKPFKNGKPRVEITPMYKAWSY